MKKILLHVCCGPCSMHVADLLKNDYKVVAYFFNPNLFPYEEWVRRYEAFLKAVKANNNVSDFFPKKALTEEEYKKGHQIFLEKISVGNADLRSEKEGGERCKICYRMRLENVAEKTKELGIENFTTTLTIGRNKKADVINEIGATLCHCEERNEVERRGNLVGSQRPALSFLEADFKKKDGFLKTIKMSKEAELYRQNYCGCEFSIRK